MKVDNNLITLNEAAKLIPGADANTLKRMRRKGVLTCYRPGKAYLTTAADVRAAVKKCGVGQKVRRSGIQATQPLPLGLTDIDLANAALDALLAPTPREKRR
jgi:uncharacterized protein YaiI (UPF0178 family)